MRRAERLFRLVQALRASPVSRAEDLAAVLEVSTRTIYRDIAHLQGSGLPIDGAAGVGYMLRPGFDLPEMTFTHTQVDALAVALSLVESLDDPELATAAREVRAKIQTRLPQPEGGGLAEAPYFALSRTTGGSDHAAALRAAIRKRRIVRLVYVDGDGRRSRRRLHPLAIWSFAEGWMVSGWCETRQDFRTFRFDRIAELTPTDEPQDDNEARSLRAFLQQESCRHAGGGVHRLR